MPCTPDRAALPDALRDDHGLDADYMLGAQNMLVLQPFLHLTRLTILSFATNHPRHLIRQP